MTERTLPTAQSTDLPSYVVSAGGAELDGTFNLVSVAIDKSLGEPNPDRSAPLQGWRRLVRGLPGE